MVILFLLQYVSVAKAILKDGPTICTALEKHDTGFERMSFDHTSTCQAANEGQKTTEEEELRQREIANKIVRNRAKVEHVKEEMSLAMEGVQEARRKIVNVYKWE